MPREDLIRFRRDSAANWTSVNPVLASGEPGYDTTSDQFRIGDGLTAWSELSPIGSEAVAIAETATTAAESASTIAQEALVASDLVTEEVNTGRLSETALEDSFLPRREPAVMGTTLYARGTSYTAGASSTAGNSYIDKLAVAIGATSVKNGGSGGSTTPALCAQYVEDTANKWIPGTSSGLVTIEAGIGEALQEDDATWQGHRRVFENQVLTALRWHRASEFRRPNHATVARDGSGTSSETIDWLSAVDLSPGVKLSSTGGGITISPNLGTAPTEIVILTVPWNSGAEAENGDYRFRVGSGAWRTGTTAGAGDHRTGGAAVVFTIASERIKLASGNDTIRLEKTTGGPVWIFGYLVMGNPTPPPIILVQDVYLNETAGAWVFPDGGHTTGARKNNKTLDVYRGIINRIAAMPEFSDGTVAVADPLPYWDPAIHLYTDGVHPNNDGHAAFALATTRAAQVVVGPR